MGFGLDSELDQLLTKVEALAETRHRNAQDLLAAVRELARKGGPKKATEAERVDYQAMPMAIGERRGRLLGIASRILTEVADGLDANLMDAGQAGRWVRLAKAIVDAVEQ